VSAHDTAHPLVGKLVRFRDDGRTHVGLVREVDAPREELRSLVVQMHGGYPRSTLSSTFSGRTLRVALLSIDGVVNRRKKWPHQIEPLKEHV
jgi:hypothetical protein